MVPFGLRPSYWNNKIYSVQIHDVIYCCNKECDVYLCLYKIFVIVPFAFRKFFRLLFVHMISALSSFILFNIMNSMISIWFMNITIFTLKVHITDNLIVLCSFKMWNYLGKLQDFLNNFCFCPKNSSFLLRRKLNNFLFMIFVIYWS